MKAPIKFIQYNLSKRLVATTELKETNAIYLLQEPYLYEGKKGAVVHQKEFFSAPKGRTAIYTPLLKDAKFTAMTRFTGRDLVAGILENTAFRKPIMIASIYLDILKTVKMKEWTELLLYCRTNKIPLLCGIDANAWSYLWNSREENRRGQELEAFLLSERASIHNINTTSTFHRVRKEGEVQESIIDITVSFNLNEDIMNWAVDTTNMLSDHRPISFQIAAQRNQKPLMRNYKSANWNTFRDTIKDKAFNKDIMTCEDIEKELGKLYGAINKGLDTTCPKKPSKIRNSHTWWNQECEKARSNLNKINKQISQSTLPNRDLWQKRDTCNKEYKKLIKKSKRESWQKFVSETEGMQETSRLVKILCRDKPQDKIPLIKNKHGTLATTHAESIRNLMEEHFPDSKFNLVNEDLTTQDKKPD